MNRRPKSSSLTDSIRSRLGRGAGPSASRRRVSRRESEARKQRMFYLGMAATAILVVGILGFGALYEYQIKPNQVLATVNGYEIKRKEYWQYESVTLYAQSVQYQNYAMQVTGTTQQQFLSQAAALEQEREDVWGSTDVNRTTLNRMIEDRLYLQAAEEMGIMPTDADIEAYALNSFVSGETPLVTPIPSPTMVPEREVAATQTAEALSGTPVPQASPVVGTPEATPMTDQSTPVTEATPQPDSSPAADGTPDMQTVLAEAESSFGAFEDSALSDAHLSREEYFEQFVKPQFVRTLVDARLTAEVQQLSDQVHVEHILVGTQDFATQLYDTSQGGASFEELAKTNSIDTATASNGGDLGWVMPGQLDPALEEAAFSLQPGQVSQPIQTEYGWHLVKVLDTQTGRPLTDAQYTSAIERALEQWLEDRRAAASIDTDYELSATEVPGTFEAPPDAPTPIAATPVPETPTPEPPFIGPVLPSGTPGASPEAATPITGGDVTVTVEASPIASEEATPVETEAASTPASDGTPVTDATPIGTPIASPAA